MNMLNRADAETREVLVRVSGACGRITLNRPRALNALNINMVHQMHAALAAWAKDDSVHFVLVDGAGERGLCAGGDIRALYNSIVANQREVATEFFRKEYQLNYAISRYPKPYVVLMDGIVMGGGIGISSHGSHRVVTERSQLAMPETAIGFIPDVGGTHLLGTAPGEIGTYMGLTGGRIGAGDAIQCWLADMMARSQDLPRLTLNLEGCTDAAAMEQCLRSFAVHAHPGILRERRAWIDECFAASTVEEILVALLGQTDAEARSCAEELKKMSPTSLKLTLRALRQGRNANSLAASLKQEFRLAQACEKGHDLIEGIRAAIVDKDRNPQWSPPRMEEVTPEMVDAYFNDTGAASLDLEIT
jgi:enoyl-CoA hydratase